jgi:glycosyltransferase involved in cell wall biosynthesis
MGARPLISVIIPTYNVARYVSCAVESALAQSYRPLEVIVVDDGSTDGTAEALKPFGRQIRNVYQPNQGPAVARNRGIREATGPWLAFLDADDRWLPHKLAVQADCLAANPNVGLVHSNLFFWDEATGQRWQPDRERHLFAGHCYAQFFRRNGVNLSSVLLRRDCLDKAGVFDPRIDKPSTEDYDLWIRIARHFELAYLREPLLLYRLHPASGSKKMAVMFEQELYVIRKALHSDAGWQERFGKQAVADRLFELLAVAAYLQFDAGNLVRARDYLSQALRLRSSDRYYRLLWLATWFPPTVVRALRRLKGAAGLKGIVNRVVGQQGPQG